MWNKEKDEKKVLGWETEHLGETTEPMNEGDSVMAFIGKGVEFKGNISYSGVIRVDGIFEGEIHTDGTLLVGEDAVISANVSAGRVISNGKIIGNVRAKEMVKLESPAMLSGSVTTPCFSIEEGVLFNGTCEMTSSGTTDHADKILRHIETQGNSLKRSTG